MPLYLYFHVHEAFLTGISLATRDVVLTIKCMCALSLWQFELKKIHLNVKQTNLPISFSNGILFKSVF
jgi:hypothetical protein